MQQTNTFTALHVQYLLCEGMGGRAAPKFEMSICVYGAKRKDNNMTAMAMITSTAMMMAMAMTMMTSETGCASRRSESLPLRRGVKACTHNEPAIFS